MRGVVGTTIITGFEEPLFGILEGREDFADPCGDVLGLRRFDKVLGVGN